MLGVYCHTVSSAPKIRFRTTDRKKPPIALSVAEGGYIRDLEKPCLRKVSCASQQ
jgi:hypothetical protein